jgi:hypothetical protein
MADQAPFNPEIHANLLPLGFTFHHFDEDWWDDGDAESGPSLAGGPAFQEYLRESDMTKVVIVESGEVDFVGDADPYDFADPEELMLVDELHDANDIMGDWMGRNV